MQRARRRKGIAVIQPGIRYALRGKGAWSLPLCSAKVDANCRENVNLGMGHAGKPEYAGCLPVFRTKARECAAHYENQKYKCDLITEAVGFGDDTDAENGAGFTGGGAPAQAEAPEIEEEDTALGPIIDGLTCGSVSVGEECFRKVSNMSDDCYAWAPYKHESETANWTGHYDSGMITQSGTLTWSGSSGGASKWEGEFSRGKPRGSGNISYSDGTRRQVEWRGSKGYLHGL